MPERRRDQSRSELEIHNMRIKIENYANNDSEKYDEKNSQKKINKNFLI